MWQLFLLHKHIRTIRCQSWHIQNHTLPLVMHKLTAHVPHSRTIPHSVGWCLIRLAGGWYSLFARLISHQPVVLFSQNESATSNQPQPASSTLLSEQTSTSHQPPANRTGRCSYTHSNNNWIQNSKYTSRLTVIIEFQTQNTLPDLVVELQSEQHKWVHLRVKSATPLPLTFLCFPARSRASRCVKQVQEKWAHVSLLSINTYKKKI
jgi:hypothetical protein